MISPKFICFSAGAGFVLSLLTGIISGNAFSHVLLRAAIFAFVFGALAAGISFLYKKFLDESVDSGGAETESAVAKPGSRIDVTIDDKELDDDEGDPKFFVENNRSGLGSRNLASDKNKISVATAETPGVSPEKRDETGSSVSETESAISSVETVSGDSSSGFKPVALEQAEKVDSAEVVNKDSEPVVQASSEVDDLPEIGDLSFEKKPEGIDSIISDSDFATSGSTSKGSTSFPDGSSADGQNANVMAQAIRTLLSKDN